MQPNEQITSADSERIQQYQKEYDSLKDYSEILDKVNRGLRTYISEMTVVFQFIERVSTIHSIDKIVQLLMSVLKELCRYNTAAIYLYEQPQQGMITKRLVAHEALSTLKRFRQTMEVDDKIYQWVFKQGLAVVIPDSFRKKNSKTFKTWSLMIAPLATDAEQIGHIELTFNRPEGSFTQQMFSILNVLIKHVAVILVNERVYEKERQTAKKYIELDMLKRDVVNTTTHEIKTPITIIQAASILLEGDHKMLKEERNELLGKIIKQTKRINMIVSELFETSQIEEQKPILNLKKINPKQMTEELLKDLHYNPDKIHFKLTIPAGLTMVIDQSGLYKVIRNLTENAIKYSPNGGEVSITVKTKGTMVEWRIEDQGLGISAQDQEKIFDKFFRVGDSLTRSVGGLGLGLYIVKKNVELNNGHIRVESQPGKGTTFILTFPKSAKAVLGK